MDTLYWEMYVWLELERKIDCVNFKEDYCALELRRRLYRCIVDFFAFNLFCCEIIGLHFFVLRNDFYSKDSIGSCDAEGIAIRICISVSVYVYFAPRLTFAMENDIAGKICILRRLHTYFSDEDS